MIVVTLLFLKKVILHLAFCISLQALIYPSTDECASLDMLQMNAADELAYATDGAFRGAGGSSFRGESCFSLVARDKKLELAAMILSPVVAALGQF